MAVTIGTTHILFRGTRTLLTSTITMDTSYNVGGEALTPGMFGLSEFTMIIPGSSKGFEVDAIISSPTAALLKLYSISANTNTALEAASGLDRSAVAVDVLIVGR